MNVATSIALFASGGELQDRVELIQACGRAVLIVADGAGAMKGGAQAAEMCLQRVRQSAAWLDSEDHCVRLLTDIDREIAAAAECGETTGVVTVISAHRIFGASVGDSAAWHLTPGAADQLTRFGAHRRQFARKNRSTREAQKTTNGHRMRRADSISACA